MINVVLVCSISTRNVLTLKATTLVLYGTVIIADPYPKGRHLDKSRGGNESSINKTL